MKVKEAIWGPGSILVTVVVAGVGLILLQQPQRSVVAGWVMIIAAAAGLVTILILSLYGPLRIIRGRLEAIDRNISEAMKRQGQDKISWEDFYIRVVYLFCIIKSKGFEPDILIGIGRSGSIVAGLLAGIFGLKPVLCVDTDWKNQDRTLLPESMAALQTLGQSGRYKNVLIVQAEKDAGTSARRVKDALSSASVLVCRVAVLWYRPGRPPDPDFSVECSATKPNWPFRLGDFKAR